MCLHVTLRQHGAERAVILQTGDKLRQAVNPRSIRSRGLPFSCRRGVHVTEGMQVPKCPLPPTEEAQVPWGGA